MSNSSRQIKFGALISYVAIAINMVTGLVYTPWMIHSIGRENYGLYTLSLSVITLFVFDFGLSAAVTRYVAKYLAEGREDKANDCLGLVYKLYIYLDIFFAILLVGVFFFIPTIYKELTPEEIESFKIVYTISAISSILTFPFVPVNGILNAHERFIELKLCDVFHKLFIVGTMTACLLMGYGLIALVVTYAVSAILTVALKVVVLMRKTNTKVNFGYKDKKLFKEIIGFSGWVTVIAISQRLTMNLAPSILGALSGLASIAILGVATTLEGYTYTFSSAINGMFLPKVSRIVASDESNVLPLMVRVGRIQFYITGLIVTAFACLGKEFIHLWVGDSFSDSFWCAILLMFPAFVNNPQEIGDTAVVAMNRVKEKGYAFIVMGVVNVLLAGAFAGTWGAIGASAAICIAYLVRTFCMDVIYYKYIKIDVISFFKDSLGKMWWQFCLVLAVGFSLNYIIPVGGWIGFILRGGIFTLSYAAIMYFCAFNEEEKNLIKKFRR